MKNLILVRHAKSSWSNPRLRDHDRPLNKRGINDAPLMAKRFQDLKISVDLILSSTSTRALETAKVFAAHINQIEIITEPKLYHCDQDDIEELLMTQDNQLNCLMIFAHNPCLTFMANDYSHYEIDNVPTCGVCVLQSACDDWIGFLEKAELFHFIYPKMFK